jgi:hypothetical protein
VADTIFTRALVQAAAAQESKQALAYQLHVPENTLLRWMSGRAQMPLQAFHRVVELLIAHEKATGAAPRRDVLVADTNLSFNIGELLASCLQCQGTQFRRATPDSALQMSSELLCCSCSFEVVHGELLARLATQAIQQRGAKIIRIASR